MCHGLGIKLKLSLLTSQEEKLVETINWILQCLFVSQCQVSTKPLLHCQMWHLESTTSSVLLMILWYFSVDSYGVCCLIGVGKEDTVVALELLVVQITLQKHPTQNTAPDLTELLQALPYSRVLDMSPSSSEHTSINYMNLICRTKNLTHYIWFTAIQTWPQEISHKTTLKAVKGSIRRFWMKSK